MGQLFQYCKKAELPGLCGGAPVKVEVTVGLKEGLLLEVPYEFNYPVRTPIEVDFLDPIMGTVTCLVELHSPLVTKGRIMRSYRCNILRRIQQQQRREDVKVPVSNVVFVKLNDEENETETTLRNISAGGVLLETRLRALPGEYLNFTFQCDGLEIPLTAEVLRVEPQKDKQGKPLFGYGCRFIQLSSVHESALRSYVFRIERMIYGRK